MIGKLAIILHMFSFVLLTVGYMIFLVFGITLFGEDQSPENINEMIGQHDANAVIADSNPFTFIFGDFYAVAAAISGLLYTSVDLVTGGALVDVMKHFPFYNEAVELLVRGLYGISTFFLVMQLLTGRVPAQMFFISDRTHPGFMPIWSGLQREEPTREQKIRILEKELVRLKKSSRKPKSQPLSFKIVQTTALKPMPAFIDDRFALQILTDMGGEASLTEIREHLKSNYRYETFPHVVQYLGNQLHSLVRAYFLFIKGDRKKPSDARFCIDPQAREVIEKMLSE